MQPSPSPSSDLRSAPNRSQLGADEDDVQKPGPLPRSIAALVEDGDP